MMFCGIHLLALLNYVVSVTSMQFSTQKNGDSVRSDKNGGGFVCSKVGNCTCLFEKLRVTVECTSAGKKLDKIASELPPTTTHL